ncbi:hypothetical protein R3P38DRAFT_2811338 [Favolaschia claudopus]|uniref:Uncharacterized protein n=1 Tax=Favolaschia claudopus TaxID=2862362 RepID=A0AAV9Z9J6_9AGAR
MRFHVERSHLTKRLAVPAYNGSLSHMVQAQALLANFDPATSRALHLPIFYQYLSTSSLSNHSHGSDCPCKRAHFAITSLGLTQFGGIPQQAALDIWPRFWFWFQRYAVVVDGMEHQGIHEKARIMLAHFLHDVYDESRHCFEHAVSQVAGVRFFLARAWRLALQDYVLDNSTLLALTSVSKFLRFAHGVRDAPSPRNSEELQEFIEGAGGLTSFASLVVQHFDVFSRGEQDDVRFFDSAVTLVLHLADSGARGVEFRAALLSQGILKPLINALSAFQRIPLPPSDSLLPSSILLLYHFLGTHPIDLWIKQALSAGMLNVLLRLSVRNDLCLEVDLFNAIIDLLAASTIYVSLLPPLRKSVTAVAEGADHPLFDHSVIEAKWLELLNILNNRLLSIYIPRITCQCSAKARRACDNLQSAKLAIGGTDTKMSVCPCKRFVSTRLVLWDHDKRHTLEQFYPSIPTRGATNFCGFNVDLRKSTTACRIVFFSITQDAE